MGHNLKLDSLVTFEDLNPKNVESLSIEGLVPYHKGQIVEKPVSDNPGSKLYKVVSVKDIFFSDSESVLCRRIIDLYEINR